MVLPGNICCSSPHPRILVSIYHIPWWWSGTNYLLFLVATLSVNRPLALQTPPNVPQHTHIHLSSPIESLLLEEQRLIICHDPGLRPGHLCCRTISYTLNTGWFHISPTQASASHCYVHLCLLLSLSLSLSWRLSNIRHTLLSNCLFQHLCCSLHFGTTLQSRLLHLGLELHACLSSFSFRSFLTTSLHLLHLDKAR